MGFPRPLSGVIRREAVILAGGASSRMGGDKARLRLGRRTFLALAREAAGRAGLPVRVIRKDLLPRCGPLGGVYTALKTTRADTVLFLSCDMPFVTPELLRMVLERLTPGKQAAFLHARGMGFPFVLRGEALPEIEKLIADQRFSLRGLARRLKACRVRLPKEFALAALNINTPEDYALARGLVKSLRKSSASIAPGRNAG